MSPEELRAAILAAGEDVVRLRAVAEDGCKGMLEPGVDHLGLADVLLSLARHPDDRVREAVACASLAFPDPFFSRAYDILAADSNHYVRTAAQRAAERRAARRKGEAKLETAWQAYAETLGEIEAKHGKGARRLAERAARRGIEDHFARLYHELVRAAEPVQMTHLKLRAALHGHPQAGLVEAAEGRFAHVMGIVKNTRAYLKRRASPTFGKETLADLVAFAKSQLADALPARAQAEAIVVDVGFDIELEADRHALVQALENVLKNAVEATAGGGEVRVSATTIRKGAEIEIVVTDGGAGMTPEELGRLFVPYRTTKKGGTGVGMLTAKRMIEEVHNGEIEVESEKGKGTKVTLRLPGKQRA